MTTRRKLTTLDKLKIMVAQAVCPDCGERLGSLKACDIVLGWNDVDDAEAVSVEEDD